MDAAERKEILSRYIGHTRRFNEVAARRSNGRQEAEVIPFSGPLRELEQEPTGREIEVLQLISDGLVNREIGQRLARPPPARQAAGALARARRSRRLPPRPDRLTRNERRRPLRGTPSTACLSFPPPVEITQQGDVPRLWKTEATSSCGYYQPFAKPAELARASRRFNVLICITPFVRD